VNGAIAGSNSLTITAGTLSGTGTVFIEEIAIGPSGLLPFLGIINVNGFTNNQANLAINGFLYVNNILALMPGTVEIGTGGQLNLAGNSTINMAGGAFNANEGSLNISNVFNLMYSGEASVIGAEVELPGLQNITVDMPATSGMLNLNSDLAVPGMLYLQRGVLNLNNQSLTINGGISTTDFGSVSGNANSNIIINGSGNAGTIAFSATGQTINNLALNFLPAGIISLGSDVTITGSLALNQGSLNLNGFNLAINGSMQTIGTGCLIGNTMSNLTISGPGVSDTLMLSPSANTLANLTINTDTNGSVYLGSDVQVSGSVNLNMGSLNLNGQTLTVHGPVMSAGSGSLAGNASSNLTFDGFGGAGAVMFTSGGQHINNLTINIGSSGGIYLASQLTVSGTLSLLNGMLGIGNNDLVISDSGAIQGGGSASYISTNGSGSLIMPVAGAGASGMFQVGTQANYAPVLVTNNAALAANFGVSAHEGVLANGTSGVDISAFQSVVNTSWEVSSSTTAGANVDLEMFWNQGMQVNGFDNTEAYISHYINGAWNKSQPTAATTAADDYFSLALTGVTSFGQFAVFDRNTTTDIKNINAMNLFTIYPNPAADYINISVAGFDKLPQLEISDALGNEVFMQPIENRVTSININYLPAGVYFVTLNNEITQQFIKK
jgi:hypothetical protein